MVSPCRWGHPCLWALPVLNISNCQLDYSMWEFCSLLKSTSIYSKQLLYACHSVLNNSNPNSPAVQIRNTGLILEASFCLTVHVQSDTNFFPLLPKYFSAVSLFSYPLPPSWLRFSLFPVPIAAKASCCHYCLWLPDPPYSLCGSQVCL